MPPRSSAAPPSPGLSPARTAGSNLLLERTGEIPDRGLGGALGERALGRLAQRRDHKRVGLWGDAEEVAGRALRMYKAGGVSASKAGVSFIKKDNTITGGNETDVYNYGKGGKFTG